MREKNTKKSKPIVFVAMSGGVDSSVAAALLKKQGYEVVGVYMKNFSGRFFPKRFSMFCPWKKDLRDVKRVCLKIGIPFRVYDFEKEYEERVINYFFEEEIKGKTPNPDILCNREIKFGLFLKKALSEGADFIATGHYVRKKAVKDKETKKIVYKLLMAKDRTKDQSYFLCLLKQHQIKKVIFPLGNYTKKQVRQIAKKMNLPTAERPESMGICFVGEVDINDFLKTRIKETPGDIVTVDGKVIGKHKGLAFYTIGQRRGIGVSGKVPYYVVAKDIKHNRLIVAEGAENKALFKKEIKLKKVNWIKGIPPKFPFSCQARIRHQQPLQKAVVKKENNRICVEFSTPQKGVAPGQFCVFYKREEMLGGGIIVQDRIDYRGLKGIKRIYENDK